jgi:hypothetical protein
MTSIDIRARTGATMANGAVQRGRDPLPRLLAQLVERAGDTATVERATSRPWASALFQGRRHLIMLRLDGADVAGRRGRFAEGIEEAEWSLNGHFVADITIDAMRAEADAAWIELSALTIEDW